MALSLPDTAAEWEQLQAAIKQPPSPPLVVQPADLATVERNVLRKMLKRRYEGIRLYRPLPLGEKAHACNAVWRLAGESNRAGKSLWAADECSRAMLGCDPYDKYPRHNGYALFVGLKLDHLALMYRTMFCEGAFQIIQDEHTRLCARSPGTRRIPGSFSPTTMPIGRSGGMPRP